MITVIPEGYSGADDALAKAGVILIKFAPGELHIPTNYDGGTLVSLWTNTSGLPPDAGDEFPAQVNALLGSMGQEYRFAVLLDLVAQWDELGASETMLDTLKEVSGV